MFGGGRGKIMLEFSFQDIAPLQYLTSLTFIQLIKGNLRIILNDGYVYLSCFPSIQHSRIT